MHQTLTEQLSVTNVREIPYNTGVELLHSFVGTLRARLYARPRIPCSGLKYCEAANIPERQVHPMNCVVHTK